jgi:hypothetical protein
MPAGHINDRFNYELNMRQAVAYSDYRSKARTSGDAYEFARLDLSASTPELGNRFLSCLAALKSAIEIEWQAAGSVSAAEAMRDIRGCLQGETRLHAITPRASVLYGSDGGSRFQESAPSPDELAVVAGEIPALPCREVPVRPTAFACRCRQPDNELVAQALGYGGEAAAGLARLHAGLRLEALPSFRASELFFMAGEGNLHPKHTAYSVPQGESAGTARFRRTHYFGNAHRALLESVTRPLSSRFLQLDAEFGPEDVRLGIIPTLGALGHELGHCVRRRSTTYEALSAADQWASVVLQEVAADAFGIVTVADTWAPRFGIDPTRVIAYHLAECLRHVDQGLGLFPDSDAMFLQLSYFVQVGALEAWHADSSVRLAGACVTVLAAVRSLARVLADAVLADRAELAIELYQAFGPASAATLRPLVEELRGRPSTSVEYVQDHLHTSA